MQERARAGTRERGEAVGGEVEERERARAELGKSEEGEHTRAIQIQQQLANNNCTHQKNMHDPGYILRGMRISTWSLPAHHKGRNYPKQTQQQRSRKSRALCCLYRERDGSYAQVLVGSSTVGAEGYDIFFAC